MTEYRGCFNVDITLYEECVSSFLLLQDDVVSASLFSDLLSAL